MVGSTFWFTSDFSSILFVHKIKNVMLELIQKKVWILILSKSIMQGRERYVMTEVLLSFKHCK